MRICQRAVGKNTQKREERRSIPYIWVCRRKKHGVADDRQWRTQNHKDASAVYPPGYIACPRAGDCTEYVRRHGE